MNFYKKIFRNKRMRFRILRAMRFIPDKQMLSIQYFVKHHRRLNLKDPKRYTEKMQWFKLYYRNPLMQQCADKYQVRAYVEGKGLGHILNDLYAVFPTAEDVTLEGLPQEFVLKLSNGSSTNLLVKDKQALDLEQVKEQVRAFYAQSGSSAGREWVYRTGEKPVVIAERYLHDSTQTDGSLRDYKILCFGGKPEYIICVDGRGTEHYCHVVYDAGWNKLPVVIGHSSADPDIPKPEKLDQMLEIAETLSADFPAARIDLYNLEGQILFGEITFFPWSGYMEFNPDSFDYTLGEKFVLPQRNV